jgi:hypothetical protein
MRRFAGKVSELDTFNLQSAITQNPMMLYPQST